MPTCMHVYALWVHCLRLRLLERFCIMGAWALEETMGIFRWVNVMGTVGRREGSEAHLHGRILLRRDEHGACFLVCQRGGYGMGSGQF